MFVCWVTCDVGEPAETARITPRVSARATGISVTLAPLNSTSTADVSLTPLLNSYRVDSKSYLIHHDGLPHDPCANIRGLAAGGKRRHRTRHAYRLLPKGTTRRNTDAT